MSKKLVTACEVAAYFQVSSETIYRLTRQGKLPAAKIGRSYRYDLEVVKQRVLAKHTEEVS